MRFLGPWCSEDHASTLGLLRQSLVARTAQAAAVPGTAAEGAAAAAPPALPAQEPGTAVVAPMQSAAECTSGIQSYIPPSASQQAAAEAAAYYGFEQAGVPSEEAPQDGNPSSHAPSPPEPQWAAPAARRGDAGAAEGGAPAGSGLGLSPSSQLAASQMAGAAGIGGAGLVADGAAPAGLAPGSGPPSQAPASQAAGAAAAPHSSEKEVGACIDTVEDAEVCSGSQRGGDVGSVPGLTSPVGLAADAAVPGDSCEGAAAGRLRKRSAECAAEAALAADTQVVGDPEQALNPDHAALAAAAADRGASAGQRPAKRRRIAGGTLGTLMAWAWRTICPAARCQTLAPGAAAPVASASAACGTAGAPAAGPGSGSQPAATCGADAEQPAASRAAPATSGGPCAPGAPDNIPGGAFAEELWLAPPDAVLDSAAPGKPRPSSSVSSAGQGQHALGFEDPAPVHSPVAGGECGKLSGSPSPEPRGGERGEAELGSDWLFADMHETNSVSAEPQAPASAHEQGLLTCEERRDLSSSPIPKDTSRWFQKRSPRIRSAIPVLHGAARARAPAAEQRSAFGGSLSPQPRAGERAVNEADGDGLRSVSPELQAPTGAREVQGWGPPSADERSLSSRSPSPEPRAEEVSDQGGAAARGRARRVRTRSLRSASSGPRGDGGARAHSAVPADGAHGGGSLSWRCAPAFMTCKGWLTLNSSTNISTFQGHGCVPVAQPAAWCMLLTAAGLRASCALLRGRHAVLL